MADLPLCPQHRERGCERSELRLLKEKDNQWVFFCACCELTWVVSKPKAAAAARLENAAKKIQQATEAERAKVYRKYFLPSRRRMAV
jgi:hypothetical protein